MDFEFEYLRLPRVLQCVGMSKSSVYAMVAQGQFPRPHRLNARAVGWLKSEVDRWCQSRSTTPPPMPAAPRPATRKGVARKLTTE